MGDDKKLETLEEELKLMKGELKQSLASVRDYLLNMELPSSEFATVLAAIGGDGEQKITMKGSFTNDQPRDSAAEPLAEEVEETGGEEAGAEEAGGEETQEEAFEPESELAPGQEDMLGSEEPYDTESGISPEDEAAGQEGFSEPGEETLPEEEYGDSEPSVARDEAPVPSSETPLEEGEPMEYDKTSAEENQSTPRVNLLANLINWVARAKKEIGYEQMPAFLEVYGISGHLSPELKETILNLCEITSEAADTGTAATWSQSMLSLHGVLTGGEAPLYPVRPAWGSTEDEPDEEEIIEVDKAKEAPVRLKLVLPDGNGESKEFCIDLAPTTDTTGD